MVLFRLPLNLLQGFNISSEDGLNNLVAEINEEFKLSFPESFTQKEYDQVAGPTELSSFALGEASAHIEQIDISITKHNNPKCSTTEVINTLAAILDREGLDRKIVSDEKEGKYVLDFHGASASRQGKPPDEWCQINVDSLMLVEVVRVVEKLLDEVLPEDQPRIWMSFEFAEGIRPLVGLHHITARLKGTGASFGTYNRFVIGDMEFFIYRDDRRGFPGNWRYALNVCVSRNGFELDKVRWLLDLMFDRGLLFFVEPQNPVLQPARLKFAQRQ